MKYDKRLIVIKEGTNIMCYHMNGNQVVRLFISKALPYSVGDIVIARVQNVKPDLKASFVELDKNTIGFLPDDEINPSCLINRSFDGRLKQGDEICVMVSKEPVKTKPCSVTMKLNIQGQYSVIHNENQNVTVSSKLNTIVRSELKDYFERALSNQPYGTIIRTNAEKADKNIIKEEILNNIKIMDNILKIMNTRKLYSKIYSAPPSFINEIRSIRREDYFEIVSDDYDIIEYLKEFFPNEKDIIRYYDDNNLSVKALYNLERALTDATESKIYLKSGGYLVIEPTEALTVIDVNSGKINKSSKSETIHIVNMEAAREIARQLILRNISGIIVIDFINYDNNDKEKEEELIKEFKALIKKDIIKTNFIDITGLGLVELTRQKKYASIYEMYKPIKLK